MQGIGLGVLLAFVLFVLRYSRVSAIHVRATLSDHRSSVERSLAASQLLQGEGSGASIYCLRGFLFFGTANSINEQITEQEALEESEFHTILIDMQRVTGVDVSALNAFAQLRKRCEADGVRLSYSEVPAEIREQLLAVDAVSLSDDGSPLIFDTLDLALEHLEDDILAHNSEEGGLRSIDGFLLSLIGDADKVKILRQAMERISCEAGATLFRQGDSDTAMYIIERGSLSAFIPSTAGELMRVKKFMPGSLVGELSAYLTQKHRTATVVADEDSVVYRLDLEKVDELDSENHELRACIHELVAKTLAERVSAMNKRLAFESR
jgi:SulP family sulfate permease